MTLALPATYRADIDGLRAIAVGAVVLHHALPHVLEGGFIGVDIFFVISGYLITQILLGDLQAGRFSLARFYARRIRRIFPALALVLAATLAFGWFALLAEEYRSLGKHVVFGAGFAANFAYWAEVSYFDAAAASKPLLHLWSLGIEEQFYILWPLLLAALFAYPRELNLAILLVAVPSFMLGVMFSYEYPAAGFYAPWARAWELAVGAMLALAQWEARTKPSRALRPRAADALSLAGLGAIVFALFWLTPSAVFPGLWALAPVLGSAALIAAGPGAAVNRLLLSQRGLVGLGLISYPLYLWHWPLLSYGRIVTSGALEPLLALAAVALAVVLAAATTRYLERPVRQHAGAVAVWGPLLAVVSVAGLGAMIWASAGLPDRPAIAGYRDNRLDLIKTPATDADCLKALGAPAIIDFCRYADGGHAQTIAIIGDSHAHVSFPGLARLAGEQGLNTLLLANNACPPLLGAPTGETAELLAICKAKIEQIIGSVAQRRDVDLVFISTRGPVYVTGSEPVITDPVVLTYRISYQALRAGLQASVQALTQAGKRVVYITENPELGHQADACQLRPLGLNLRDCRPYRDQVEARQKPYLAAIDNIPGLAIAPVIDAFCPEARCLVSYRGFLLYADDDHLSVAGSHFLAQRVLRDWLP